MSLLRALLVVGVTLLLAACGGDQGDTGSTARDGPSRPFLSVPSLGEASPDDDVSEIEDMAQEHAQRKARRQGRKLPRARGPLLGADISWPQCPTGLGIPADRTQGMPLPLPAARFVIVGITNGPGFTRNPCLAEQVAWVRQRRLLIGAYSVASFPNRAQFAKHRKDGPFRGGTRVGGLRNVGYQQARANLTTMRWARLSVPAVWIDVEPVITEPWSRNLSANAAVVQGVARAYTDVGLRIGVYSTAHLWDVVVGNLRLGVPEWRAAGFADRAAALSKCVPAETIQGGRAVLSQWVRLDRDQNITCPRADPVPWFHAF